MSMNRKKKGEHIEREAEWILANAMAKIRNTGIGKNTSWNGIFPLIQTGRNPTRRMLTRKTQIL